MRALLILVLLVPAASAFLPSEHVIDWRQDIHHADAANDWDGDVIPVTITRPHTWAVSETTIDVIVSMNVGITGSNVQRTFRVAISGNDLNFCSQTISTGGALAQRWAYGGSTHCPDTSSGVHQAVIGTPQNWTFSNTGAATIEFLVASVYVIVQETVTTMTTFESLTGLTAFEFALFPFLAFIGYILWGRANDAVVRGFGATLCLLAGVLLLLFGLRAGLADVWAGTVAFSAALMALGGYLLTRMMLDELTEAAA